MGVWDLVLIHTRHAEVDHDWLAVHRHGAGHHLPLMTVVITVALLTVLILGVNTLFWSTVGVGRLAADHLRRLLPGKRYKAVPSPGHRFNSDNVAILIPAHNEAVVLEESLRAASALLPLSQIHVISDSGSSAEAARRDSSRTTASLCAGMRIATLSLLNRCPGEGTALYRFPGSSRRR